MPLCIAAHTQQVMYAGTHQQRWAHIAMPPARVWSPPLEGSQTVQSAQVAQHVALPGLKQPIALAPRIVPPAVMPQAVEPRTHGSNSSQVSVDAGSRGAISQLQEFVQSSKDYPIPVKCQILQWAPYSRRMVGASLQFRATVAFLLEGVPHHVLGGWRSSKKLAQRDAAERALSFFITIWGENSLKPTPVDTVVQDLEGIGEELHEACISSDHQAASSATHGHEARVLDAYCRANCVPRAVTHEKPHGKAVIHVADGEDKEVSSLPRWQVSSSTENSGGWEATVELALLEVPHMFEGPVCDDAASAVAATAKRVLWYLGAPGYKELFEPDISLMSEQRELAPPTQGWNPDLSDVSVNESERAAQRKTEIMHVQNKLQQRYSKELEPGHSVWEWKYESKASEDPAESLLETEDSTSLCLARVRIPLADREFCSEWRRGQLDARLDACALVSAFLDGKVDSSVHA